MSVFLSHTKTRHSYDFSLYFPHKLLISFWAITSLGDNKFDLSHQIFSLKDTKIEPNNKKEIISRNSNYKNCAESRKSNGSTILIKQLLSAVKQ